MGKKLWFPDKYTSGEHSTPGLMTLINLNE